MEEIHIMFYTLSDIQYLDELEYEWYLQAWQSPHTCKNINTSLSI